MGKKKDKKAKLTLERVTQAMDLEQELKHVVWRLVEDILAGRSSDPELVVTLRGSTEQLIELVCEDN